MWGETLLKITRRVRAIPRRKCRGNLSPAATMGLQGKRIIRQTTPYFYSHNCQKYNCTRSSHSPTMIIYHKTPSPLNSSPSLPCKSTPFPHQNPFTTSPFPLARAKKSPSFQPALRFTSSAPSTLSLTPSTSQFTCPGDTILYLPSLSPLTHPFFSFRDIYNYERRAGKMHLLIKFPTEARQNE